jgi:hypothetical protein
MNNFVSVEVGLEADVDTVEPWDGVERRSGKDRRSGEDRRTGEDRRSGLGFRPDPDRRVGASVGASRCPWGNADRRQTTDRRKPNGNGSTE